MSKLFIRIIHGLDRESSSTYVAYSKTSITLGLWLCDEGAVLLDNPIRMGELG